MSLFDKIIIALLILSFILGWFRGFLRSLIGPFAFSGCFFFAVLFYDVNNNLLVAALIVLLGSVGVAIALSTLFTIALATVNKEYRGKVFLPSRMHGSLINMFWQGNLLGLLLITIAALPLSGPRFESLQDQILNSPLMKSYYKHVITRIPELAAGIQTIQNFQDPQTLTEIQSMNEYKSFITTAKVQDLMNNSDFQDAYEKEDYLRMFRSPALREVLTNNGCMDLFTAVLQKIYKSNYQRIKSSPTLKLCDFGFARTTPQKGGTLTDYVATRWYRSPELLLGGSEYGREVDMWAIGCIMGELTDGQPLFPGENEIDQLYLIQKMIGSLTPEQQESFQKNPRFIGLKFPDISRVETLEKRYLGKLNKVALNFMNSLLKMDPNERMNSSEAILHPFFNGIREENEARPMTSLVSQSELGKIRGRSGIGLYQPHTFSNQMTGSSFTSKIKNRPIIPATHTPTDNKKPTIRVKEDQSSSPPPLHKDPHHSGAVHPTFDPKSDLRSIRSIATRDSQRSKTRASPFMSDPNEFDAPGVVYQNDYEIKIERQRSKEGLRYQVIPERNQLNRNKKKSEEPMFNIYEEEDQKITPRLKPNAIKKKPAVKPIYSYEVSHENSMQRGQSRGLFTKGGVASKPVQETLHTENDSGELSNHQSARQLPNIYSSHQYVDFMKRSDNKNQRFNRDEDPDLGGGPQYYASYQPHEESHHYIKSNKGYGYEYNSRVR